LEQGKIQSPKKFGKFQELAVERRHT